MWFYQFHEISASMNWEFNELGVSMIEGFYELEDFNELTYSMN